jgi:hypothetical protein
VSNLLMVLIGFGLLANVATFYANLLRKAIKAVQQWRDAIYQVSERGRSDG